SQHAKLFERDGTWFIEDLQSSNGTFVKGVRINEPVALSPGTRFTLCRYGFEVVRIDLAGAIEQEATPVEAKPPNPRRAGADMGTVPPVSGADPDDRLVAYVLKTQPQAWAYYLRAVPRLLLHPARTARGAIAEPIFPALGPRDLTGY